MAIHPTAVVDPGAEIAGDADIGPFCVVGADVRIGSRTRLIANVFLEGPLVIGDDNVFFPYTTAGVAPQDLKYRGERSRTEIGDRNKIRESVTIHRGTEGGGMVTSIGSDNLLMAYTHIAHDVRLGNHCVLANGTTCGGHVVIEDWAVIGAFTGLHQFCRIGTHAMIGGYSVVTQDVLPYSTTVSSRELKVFGANKTGLERRGFAAASIEPIQKALKLLTRSELNTSQALERIAAEVEQTPEIAHLVEFIRSSQRGVVK
jgi:UDP-N-acetylglucosamine acyltransferase